MAKEQAKKPVKAKEAKLSLRLNIEETKVLEKLKIKIGHKSGSKALLHAAEMILTNDYEKQINDKNEIIEKIASKHTALMRLLYEKQKIEAEIYNYIKV